MVEFRHPVIRKIYWREKHNSTTNLWRSQISFQTQQWTTVVELEIEQQLKEVLYILLKSSKQQWIHQMLHRSCRRRRMQVLSSSHRAIMGPRYRSLNYKRRTSNIWKDKLMGTSIYLVNPKSIWTNIQKKIILNQIPLAVLL